MIMINRTHDMNVVRDVFAHPQLYRHLRDDTCPAKAEDFRPINNSHCYYLVGIPQEYHVMGVMLFHPITLLMYQVHIAVLPDYWGQSEALVRGALHWMKENTSVMKIIAIFPATNRHVYHLAKRCDFVDEGLLKNSTKVNGVVLDQHVLGFNLGD